MNMRANPGHVTLIFKEKVNASAVPERPVGDGAVSKVAGTVVPRILIVEDQEDVRRMMVLALEMEGYQADEASNAHEGLRRLRQRWYRLVLSDYAMPGATGTWMLEEAARLGLLRQTVAVIVTAHPDVRAAGDVAVISKPLDLELFLEQVRQLVGPPSVAMPSPAVASAADAWSALTGPVELVLYINSTSAASIQAWQDLERLLAEIATDRVRCTVIDLCQNPSAGEADRIAFTPTLVKRRPGPRTWVLGDLRNRAIMTDLLRSSGLDVAG
jgi:CheY-like chemotaxis protein